MDHPIELGAFPYSGGTRFGAWALGRSSAEVEIEGGGRHAMQPAGDGYFVAELPDVHVGARYWFRFDGGERVPDLASRWQPEGNDGSSVVVADNFAWTDTSWAGVERQDQVVYELHIGTFTAEGTWQAAGERLEHLRELGVTVIQLMPVGTFKGAFGWGYDTTLPFAPFAAYGSPDDMRQFIDRAHGLGLGVILDVVYNHAGTGAHYKASSEQFFTDRYENEWGESFNFDGENSRAVRDFFVANAAYWIADFHLDGLRIDAVQALFDSSDVHILREITEAARQAAGDRKVYVVVENQPQQRSMIEAPEHGGFGVDAMYNDDFHHAMHVATTGHDDFYYQDYRGTPQELVSALKYGFLYQGQRSHMRGKPYGTPNLHTPPEHFLHFLENHDQVANSARGLRLSGLVSPARLRAMTALLLLGRQTPCLFQGQEFGSSRPFLYFLGLEGDEGQEVNEGRREALSQFPSVQDPAMLASLPDPTSPDTFNSCKLDWSEVAKNQELVAMHRELLTLRRSTRCFSQAEDCRIDGAVMGPEAALIRYMTDEPGEEHLLLVNFGRDLVLDVVPEPLLAPPSGHRWQKAWSSEDPRYGGAGRLPFPDDAAWRLAGDSAVLLRAQPVKPA